MDDIPLLLDLIDQAYDRRAWHGSNLKGSIRGLTAERAARRPAARRHSIVEIVLHAAYWKYAARRRLLGEKRGSFPLPGSNWFPVTAPLDPAAWAGHRRLLDAEHAALRRAIAGLDPARLGRVETGSSYTPAQMIQGVAAHDLYHAGQIQLLKRLVGADPEGMS